jgi:hypothetical protein
MCQSALGPLTRATARMVRNVSPDHRQPARTAHQCCRLTGTRSPSSVLTAGSRPAPWCSRASRSCSRGFHGLGASRAITGRRSACATGGPACRGGGFADFVNQVVLVVFLAFWSLQGVGLTWCLGLNGLESVSSCMSLALQTLCAVQLPQVPIKGPQRQVSGDVGPETRQILLEKCGFSGPC